MQYDLSKKLRMATAEIPISGTQAHLAKPDNPFSDSLTPFRVGSVPYLNAVPLTYGFASEIVFAAPSELANMLRRQELDAALVSVVEVLANADYDVLDGVAIASLGEVKSVLLAHRGPIEKLAEVFCDPASLTSVQLLRVLLAERGLNPVFRTLQEADDLRRMPDAAMLIGDRALDFLHAPHPEHQIWDLGAAWRELTGLPFVFAVWTLRRAAGTEPLRKLLRQARDFGLEMLDHIISSRCEYTYEFRKDYLSWHVHYHLGSEEKRGLTRFIELLRKHLPDPVYEPRFVA
jgi:chorismate dehydratase